MSYEYNGFNPVPEQLTAILHPSAPLLIIAGAGTGKTATLLHRIRHQVMTGQMDPEHILVLTFTEKATAELVDRIGQLNVPNGNKISISTFHSFCNTLVNDYGPESSSTFSLIDSHDIAYILLNRIEELTFLRSSQFKINPRDMILKGFIPFVNRVRDELITPEELNTYIEELTLHSDDVSRILPGITPKLDPEETIRQLHDLVDLYSVYQEWKSELSVIDYGDMIQKCWQTVQNQRILGEIRKKYRHIIVDEFQDNNFALNRIVNKIGEKKPSITVVGDEDQCIYSFRGANYYNIHEFREKYQDHPEFKEISLETNFRSTSPILSLANASIAIDPNRTQKSLRPFDDSSHEKPTWFIGPEEAYLSRMLDTIRLHTENGINISDIAVLCRTANHVQRAAHFLESNHIPVQVFRDRFMGIHEIRVFTAWQYVLVDNNRYNTALMFLLNLYYGMEDVLDYHMEIDSIINRELNQHLPEPVEWVFRCIQELAKKIHQGSHPDEMVWNILNTIHLLDDSKTQYRYRDRLLLRNIGYIISQSVLFTSQHPKAQYSDWLLYYDLLIENPKTPAFIPDMEHSGTGVQVMTVHKSKGLEFPVVFLPFLQSGRFPLNYHYSQIVDTIPEPWFKWTPMEGFHPKTEHVHEERRIFYVALTRAESSLYLCSTEKRQSIFLNELKEYLNKNVKQIQLQNHENKPMSEDKQNPKDRIIQELHRELHMENWEHIHQLTSLLQVFSETGTADPSNPYAYLVKQVDELDIPEPDMLELSASAVDEYIQCPYKYRLNRIDRIPQRKSTAQMTFGVILHSVLNNFHENEDQTKKQLFDLLDYYWSSDAFEYGIREEEFRKQAEDILNNYWSFHKQSQTHYEVGEVDFSFDLEDDRIRLKGKIDRIDSKDGVLHIIDYKTGKKPSRDDTKSSIQLALYVEALNKNSVRGIEGKPGTAQLLYLKHLDDLYKPYTFTQEDIEDKLDKIRKTAEGIRKREFPQKPSDFTCNHCDYRDFLCPAWEND